MEKKIIIAILVVIVVLAIVFAYNQIIPSVSTEEQACINSDGTVKTSLCCKSASDFPNSCLIGACGCALTDSHEVKVCECPEGKCFNGNACA